MIGSQIGNFRIVDKLGEGGMGVVYKAIDIQLDRPVAIKMLNADLARNPELVQRFQSEARAQANLNHTNLATLYTFFVDEANAFMVMEFVEGENFDQMIRRNGPMSPTDAVPWFKQALLGIGAAHRVGIIHRDIKPSNLMLNRQGIVKVMDFGIAKSVGTRGMTRTGLQLGTLPYMSPEQIQNRTVDTRSDIYSLGITLYEMLSGHVPFAGDSDFQIMQDHVSSSPPPLSRYYAHAPREFEGVVAKALAKNPDDRFQTVEEFSAGLEHPQNIVAPPPPVAVALARGADAETRVTEVAPGPAPSTLSTPMPVAVVPSATSGADTAPARTVPVNQLAPQTAPRISGKLIIAVGVAAVAVIAILAMVLWPAKKTAIVPASPTPAPASTPRQVQQGSASNVVPTGSEESKTAVPETVPQDSSKHIVSEIPSGNGVSDQLSSDGQRHQTAQAQPSQRQPTPLSQPTPHQSPTPGTQLTPQATPTQSANGQSFIVRHRHMDGSQTEPYFCVGVLAVKADGTVAYACGATNDPTHRCEQVVFPTGTIRELKITNGGELHVGTSGLGNWDFVDYNVAGRTAGAYQAILPFVK